MRSKLEPLAPAAILLVLALARLAIGDPFVARRPPAEPRHHPPVISASAQAVLGELAVGDALGPLEVTAIRGPTDREITVELGDGAQGMRAWIVRRGARPHQPPRHTARFDLFYGSPSPGMGVEEAPERVANAVLEALAAHVDEVGADVPSDM